MKLTFWIMALTGILITLCFGSLYDKKYPIKAQYQSCLITRKSFYPSSETYIFTCNDQGKKLLFEKEVGINTYNHFKEGEIAYFKKHTEVRPIDNKSWSLLYKYLHYATLFLLIIAFLVILP